MNNDSSEILIRIQPTPNPNAIKFIANRPIIIDGKISYENQDECHGNTLAKALFDVPGVQALHFYQNVATITHAEEINKDELIADITSILKQRLPDHNPNFSLDTDKKEERKLMSPERQKIEEVLDQYIRPGLRGDGGDIDVVDYVDHVLTVRYEGACGSCPSATTGTLMAIESILRDEFDPEIQVIPLWSNNPFGF